jgi:hypothetical protein
MEIVSSSNPDDDSTAITSPHISEMFYLERMILSVKSKNVVVNDDVPMTNPGFETSDKTGWTSNANCTVEMADKHSGVWSLRFGAQDCASQEVAAAPGRVYSFSYWSKKDGGNSGNTPQIKFRNAAHAQIGGSQDGANVANSVDWTQRTFTSTIPAPAGTAFIEIFINHMGVGTSGYYDDFTIWYDSSGFSYSTIEPVRIYCESSYYSNFVALHSVDVDPDPDPSCVNMVIPVEKVIMGSYPATYPNCTWLWVPYGGSDYNVDGQATFIIRRCAYVE